MSSKALCYWTVRPGVRSFQSDIVTTISNEWLDNFDKTVREYSSAPADDLIKLWRSKVKVTAGCRGGKGIHVDAWAPKFILQLMH